MRQALQRHSTYHVYMVQCADGTYYTGYTNDVEARVKLHNSGHGAKSLNWKGKRPVELVYAKGYRYYMRALQGEQWLKRRSRAEKEALIQGYEKARFGTRRLGPNPPCFAKRSNAWWASRGPSVRLEVAGE